MAFWLKDNERCAFGLGWEQHRRGVGIDTNPFGVNSWQWKDFRTGYVAYRESESATYSKEEK